LIILAHVLWILAIIHPKSATEKIKNYFRVQAEEPLQGLLCQNYPRQKVLFA
jgi:hypothetical protein